MGMTKSITKTDNDDLHYTHYWDAPPFAMQVSVYVLSVNVSVTGKCISIAGKRQCCR